MQLDAFKKYAPSWETSLPLLGPVLGSAAGLALRSEVCDVRTKFGSTALNLINSIGQTEIGTVATTGAVLIPLAAKIAHDAYYSEKSRIVEKVVDAAKKNITKGQAIAAGVISGVGLLGMAGMLKPAMEAICNSIAPEIVNPSGHFLTRVLTLPLALSVTKSISKNCSEKEKIALMSWCGLNAIKDGVMLCATIANCYHTPAEAAAGTLIALAGTLGLYSILSEPETAPSTSRMVIKSAGPSQFTVTYGTEKALIDLDSGEILEGSIPSEVQLHAKVWAAVYWKELQEQPERALFLVRKGTA